jgi:hypothetical protein
MRTTTPATHALLVEAGVDSMLLARLGRQSQLYPELRPARRAASRSR